MASLPRSHSEKSLKLTIHAVAILSYFLSCEALLSLSYWKGILFIIPPWPPLFRSFRATGWLWRWTFPTRSTPTLLAKVATTSKGWWRRRDATSISQTPTGITRQRKATRFVWVQHTVGLHWHTVDGWMAHCWLLADQRAFLIRYFCWNLFEPQLGTIIMFSVKVCFFLLPWEFTVIALSQVKTGELFFCLTGQHSGSQCVMAGPCWNYHLSAVWRAQKSTLSGFGYCKDYLW